MSHDSSLPDIYRAAKGIMNEKRGYGESSSSYSDYEAPRTSHRFEDLSITEPRASKLADLDADVVRIPGYKFVMSREYDPDLGDGFTDILQGREISASTVQRIRSQFRNMAETAISKGVVFSLQGHPNMIQFLVKLDDEKINQGFHLSSNHHFNDKTTHFRISIYERA